MDTYTQALHRFKDLLERAQGLGLKEPTAMAVATSDSQGYPSARMVLLKGVDERGFVFYTNLRSRKAQQLSANPRASLCFFWDPLMEQVIVEGAVEPVSNEEADAYWASRPRENQLASLVSLQSQPLDSRQTLESQLSECRARYLGKNVPRPPHWSGFRVMPDRMEFWKTGPSRLNERVLYQKGPAGWAVGLLYP